MFLMELELSSKLHSNQSVTCKHKKYGVYRYGLDYERRVCQDCNYKWLVTKGDNG